MPYRGDAFFPLGCYHIYNRGVDGQPTFFSAENYIHLLRLLRRELQRCPATVIAYCLMPNHYHLLLRQDGERSLSNLLGAVFNAYVQAVNRQLPPDGLMN